MRIVARFVALVAVAAVAASAPVRAQAPVIRIVLLGTGGGPNPNFSQRAGPSAWVEAGSERLLIDAGRGAATQFARAGLSARDVTRIFLTHLHSDHVFGLPDVWLSGWWIFRESPLEVRGPSGTRAMTEHLREAFAADVALRVAPPERLRRDTAAIAGFDIEEGVVYERNGARVTAIRVDHGPVPTFGYRIDYGGRSVVFSGDNRRSENLIAKSQNVDVLFHNMLAVTPEQLKEEGRPADGRRAALELLATPEDAGDAFARSRCKVGILIHSTPGPAGVARVRTRYSGRLEFPDDLTEVVVGDDVVVRPLKPLIK
jgi:ribonuclease Z